MVKTADQQYMQLAIYEARMAGERGEVPVGAVLVDRAGDILAADGNRTIEYCDPAGHAEMLVLRAAGERLNNYRLPSTTLYVTIEPCVMCAGAMVHARIERLIFGAEDPKAGGVVSRYIIGSDGLLNHRFTVEGGCCAEESAALLKNFFKMRREQQKNTRR
jgi:tRNA(adenine34) deaminase